MAEPKPTIERARSLVADCNYHEAQTLLIEALLSNPENPNLNAELGLIYCYGQKEFKAASLLPKTVGAEQHRKLAEVLRDYFHCRKQLAAKFHVPDEKAAELREMVGRYIEEPPVGIGIKLSACMIVKNEETFLERCLKSLQPIVDEIVVVDTGSTDRTVEIARQYNAVIGHFEWCDDFSAARNESLHLASGNWALWIDADEELDPAGYDQIREGLIRPQFAGYYFQIINSMDVHVEASAYVHTAVRLFRIIPGIGFEGRIHEQIINGFKERGYVPATLTKAIIRHYGYLPEVMSEKKKLQRTLTMLEREVADAPEDPFHWFNLSNAYWVGSRSEDAERAGRNCIGLIKNDDAPYGPAAFQILCSALIELGQPVEALEMTKLAEQKGYHTVINQFERAQAFFEMNRFDEAIAAVDQCIAMEWPIGLTGDYAIKTYKAHALRAQILCALGRLDEAEASADCALNKHPDYGMALFAKALIWEKLQNWDVAFELFLRCSSAAGLQICHKHAARVAMRAGKVAEAAVLYQEYWMEHQQDSEAWLGWVKACEAMDDPAGAIFAYEQVGEENVADADLFINWGRALEALAFNEEALKKYERAIELAPQNANAYFNRGDLLYQLFRFAEAANAYEKGLERKSDWAQGWFVLGNCYARLSRLDHARRSYDRALAIVPGHAEAKLNLELLIRAA